MLWLFRPEPARTLFVCVNRNSFHTSLCDARGRRLVELQMKHENELCGVEIVKPTHRPYHVTRWRAR